MRRWVESHIEWIISGAVLAILFAAKAISAQEVAPVAKDVAVLQARLDTMSKQIDYMYREWGGPPVQPVKQ